MVRRADHRDNTGVRFTATIFTLAECRTRLAFGGGVWAAATNGLVHLSRDNANLQNVHATEAGPPEWSPSAARGSPFDADTA